MSYRFRTVTLIALTATALLAAGCGANNTTPGQSTQTINQPTTPATEPSADTPDDASAAPTDGTSQAAVTPAASPAAGGEVTISRGMEHRITEAGSTHSLRCDGGGDIDVRADNVTVTITGDCQELEIDGSQNTVTAEITQEIDVQGNTNSVTASEVQELSIEGNANNATLTSITEIDIEGPDNTVNYETGDPRVEDEGTNTTINRP